MTNELGAGDWHQQILQNGLYPDFVSRPAQYREENNQSAKRNMDTVREKVGEWQKQGAVIRLASPAWCTSPLSVAEKLDTQSGTVKKRVVLDLSRHVNKHVKKWNVQMEDLRATEGMREEGDWMAVFDLENQFFHVKLRPDAYGYFGFCVPDENGTNKFYCFMVMVYGFASAVATVTRLVKPVTGDLHRKGIRVAVYVDNGQVAAQGKEMAEQQFQFTLLIFQLAGWNVQWKKTSQQVAQEIRYLGFEVNSNAGCYKLPQDKMSHLLQVVAREWNNGLQQTATPVRAAAELLGRLAACRLSHGKVLHIMSRHLQHQVGTAAETRGWDCAIVWQVESMTELKWMQENLGKYNNKEYRVENKGFRKITVAETEKVKDIVLEKAEAAEANRTADQNGMDSCTVAQERETRWVQDYKNDVPEWMEDGLRELRTAEKFLEGMGKTGTERKELQGKRIYWETSSRNGAKFLRHGARNTVVQQRATRVAEKEHDLKVELIPIWVGKNRKFTEEESYRTDEWDLQEEHFQQLLCELQTQPTIDGFASSINTKCARFFSKTAQPGSTRIDFFAQGLKVGEVYYCCRPVKLAAHCIRKI